MPTYNDENNVSSLIKVGVQKHIMGNILDIAKSLFPDDKKKLAQFIKLVKKASYNGISIMNDTLNMYDLKNITRMPTDELLPRVVGSVVKRSDAENDSGN